MGKKRLNQVISSSKSDYNNNLSEDVGLNGNPVINCYFDRRACSQLIDGARQCVKTLKDKYDVSFCSRLPTQYRSLPNDGFPEDE